MSDGTTTHEPFLSCNSSAVLALRKAHERRHPSPEPKYRFDTSVPNRLLEQTRISILCWNLAPRRGRLGAIEEHIAGKWHIITSKEAIEYLQHKCLMNQLYITHLAGCALLFNKDTFRSDVRVNSVYIHQQVVKEGQSGWVFQAVISRASFRRIPRNGKSYFTMMTLHCNNQYAKKRAIAKNLLLAVRTVMHQEQIDTYRRRSVNEQRLDSTSEEALANTNLPIPHGPAPLWGPGGVPGEWSDVCGFIKPPGSETEWHIRMHGAFERNPSRNYWHQTYRPEFATTKYGFISYMSTHGWLIAHPQMGNIGGHSSGKGTVHTTTSGTTWPSTQEIHVAIRVRKRDSSRIAA